MTHPVVAIVTAVTLLGGCVAPPPVVAPIAPAMQLRARLLRIEDTRRDESLLLDSLMHSGDDSLRGAAALTAGRIGARSHLAAIMTVAAHAAPDAAADAFFALALLRDTAAIPLATSALAGPSVAGVEAANLLGVVGEPARAAITSALGNTAIPSPTLGALLLAAGRLRPVPAPEVSAFVVSPDTALAWRATYALARGRSAAGARNLLVAANSPSSAVREQAARGLGKAIVGDSLADSALSNLRRLVHDSEPRVRINAVRALASFGSRARNDLLPSLADRNAHVRRTAAESLDLVLDSTVAPWMSALQSDTAFTVQSAVMQGAARRGIELGLLAPWRTSPDWHLRAASFDVSATLLGPDVITRIAPALNDDDARVRTAALTALGAVAASRDSLARRDTVRALARRALADPDFEVRATALGILTSRPTREDLAAALDMEAATRADRDLDARLAFWTLADSAVRRDTGAATAFASRFAVIPRPADPLERAAASRIARFAAWSDVAGTPRPIEWYQARVHEARETRAPVARIATDRGVIELALFAEDAPLTVFNFDSLARAHYFDGQRFHRVVPNFVVQGGDPRGDGNGGPGYAIRDELNRHRYERGALGMALSGPNTGGSQFFITHSPQPHLDGGYTVFGQLVSGGEVLDRIMQGDRIVRITIH